MSKLLVVIVDGLCTESLACAQVPSLDSLAKRGIYAGQLQALQPLHTLSILVSLFTSMPPHEHGVLCNSGAAPISSHAISLFSLLRYRQHNVAAFYSRDRLGLLFPMGSLQTGMLINSQSIRNVDRELAEQAARHLQRDKPDCCLLYLEGTDISGSHFGFLSEPYLESVEQADRALGMIMEHLLYVGADREYAIMLAGPGIRQGVVVEQPVSLLDLAPTMAAILGLAPHPDWRGRMLAEWFQHKPLEMRPFSSRTSPSGRKREQLAA
jgi:predicted AlkP superfamily pyrophosphatase or phosphodiesterase